MVIKEGSRFRMWYLAAPRLDSRIPGDVERIEWYRPVAYTESADGIHWTKSNLGLAEFRGSRNKKLVSIEPVGEPYARAFDFVAVWLDPASPTRAAGTAKLPQSSSKAQVQWTGRKTLPVHTPFRVKVTWPAGVDDGRLHAMYIEGNRALLMPAGAQSPN